MFALRAVSLAVISLCCTVTARAASGAECAQFERAFDAAAATRQVEAVREARKNWLDDNVCGEHRRSIDERYYHALIDIADADPAQRETALADVKQNQKFVDENWRIAEHIGDYYWRVRDRSNAFYWYEQTLNFLKTHPDQHPGAKKLQELVTKAGAAKSKETGEQDAKGDFYQTRAAADGKLGGLYTNFREVVAISVPLPVRFFYNKAEFTPEGEAAVRELARAAKEQNLTSVKLVGHTDPKGSDAYNMELSRRRVEAVRTALQQQGVTARIDIDWRGKRQPIDASALRPPPQGEELWALERRVEWVREGGQ